MCEHLKVKVQKSSWLVDLHSVSQVFVDVGR